MDHTMSSPEACGLEARSGVTTTWRIYHATRLEWARKTSAESRDTKGFGSVESDMNDIQQTFQDRKNGANVIFADQTRADLHYVRWVSFCRDLVQLPVAA